MLFACSRSAAPVDPTPLTGVAPSEAETLAPSETETVTPSETETVAPSETETVAPSETETVTPSETETPEAKPYEAPGIARWCFVALAGPWAIACGENGPPNPPRWVPVHCMWDVDWTAVPWDVMPTSVTQTGWDEDRIVPEHEVAQLGTCDLGVTPRSAIDKVVALSTPTGDPHTTVVTEAARGAVHSRALPRLSAGAPNADFEAAIDGFAARYLNKPLPYGIDFEASWRFDANGDGKDEGLALYKGVLISPHDEDSHSPHSSITEGLVWIDGRRPKHVLDINVNESSDHFEGLEACALVRHPDSGLLAVAVHDSGTFPCGGLDDTLELLPLDPTADKGRSKPLTVDPRPVARVRDPYAPIFNRKYQGLGELFGFRPGQTPAEVRAVLNAAKAPKLDTPFEGDTWHLASGPSFFFRGGELVGLSIPSPKVADALRGRGLDHPILDVLGEGVAIARALGGRRGTSFVFDGVVDTKLGLTLSLEVVDGRVASLELRWHTRRPHLGASDAFFGLRLGSALTKPPRTLAKLIEANELELGIDGQLTAITVRAAATPSKAVAKEPLLGLVGQPRETLLAKLGPPDIASPPTWFAPSPDQPAWSLRATFDGDRVTELRVEQTR